MSQKKENCKILKNDTSVPTALLNGIEGKVFNFVLRMLNNEISKLNPKKRHVIETLA